MKYVVQSTICNYLQKKKKEESCSTLVIADGRKRFDCTLSNNAERLEEWYSAEIGDTTN